MNMIVGSSWKNVNNGKNVAVSGYYNMVAMENYDTWYINTWLKSFSGNTFISKHMQLVH